MDGFFLLSKVFWLLAAPSNALIFVAMIGLALLAVGLGRLGAGLISVAVIGQMVFGFSPLANYIVSPLEERFPPFVNDGRPVNGIILLGGAEVPDVALSRSIPALNDAGERIIAFSALARTYPGAKLVFTGATGALSQTAVEAQAVRYALEEVGIDPARVTFEARSRNTAENARFTRAMVQPEPGSRWLLVTSAFHMPRAIGCFRAAGFPVIAYPVDYRTIGRGGLSDPFTRAAQGQDLADLGTKEWIGLLAYYASGRIGDLFPSP
ncbi:MAG: hypothetical protein B7Z15_08470 [Rhizobiales bacterium 32-66-8]|nr:MAG: hypothetical protein B7Z15_08470 [Rhizobiales bacterium 32-66-8]